MKFISALELKKKLESASPLHLIDIREDYELEDLNIGAQRIKMAEVIDRRDEIPRDIPVVFHCESGRRSKAVVETLSRKFGFSNLFSLEGGAQGFLALESSNT